MRLTSRVIAIIRSSSVFRPQSIHGAEEAGEFECGIDPAVLLALHDELLNSVRTESGYHAARFKSLVLGMYERIAAYAQLLPASDRIHHSEPGGLLRFCLDSAFIAPRHADGLILAPEAPLETRSAEEQVVRYACLVSSAVLGLARVLSRVTVVSGCGEVWDPASCSLLRWSERVRAKSVHLTWASDYDATRIASMSAWMARDIIPQEAIDFLEGGEGRSLKATIQAISGREAGVVSAVSNAAFQAAVEKDMSTIGSSPQAFSDPLFLIVSTLRTLIRDEWKVNTPGTKAWITSEGVFLVVPSSIEEVRRKISRTSTRQAYTDALEIRSHLVARSLLTYADGDFTPYELFIDEPGIPAHRVLVALVTMPYVIGVDAFSYSPVNARVSAPTPDATCERERLGSAIPGLVKAGQGALNGEIMEGMAPTAEEPKQTSSTTEFGQPQLPHTNRSVHSTEQTTRQPPPEDIIARHSTPSEHSGQLLRHGKQDAAKPIQDVGALDDPNLSLHECASSPDPPKLKSTVEESDSDVFDVFDDIPPLCPPPAKGLTRKLLSEESDDSELLLSRCADGSKDDATPSKPPERSDLDTSQSSEELASLSAKLGRYNESGGWIFELAKKHIQNQDGLLFVHNEKVCVQYPDALDHAGIDPRAFVDQARSQFILERRPNSPDGFIWKDRTRGTFLVLNNRISSLLKGLVS